MSYTGVSPFRCPPPQYAACCWSPLQPPGQTFMGSGWPSMGTGADPALSHLPLPAHSTRASHLVLQHLPRCTTAVCSGTSNVPLVSPRLCTSLPGVWLRATFSWGMCMEQGSQPAVSPHGGGPGGVMSGLPLGLDAGSGITPLAAGRARDALSFGHAGGQPPRQVRPRCWFAQLPGCIHP